MVTGASGAGKTAAVNEIASRGHAHLRCWYFDSIGVPSPAAMTRDFGSPEGWQSDATQRWIARLSAEATDGVVDVLDGQTRPSFVLAAARTVRTGGVRVVLLECSPAVRRERLVERGQAQLANRRMDGWSDYLRREALDLGLPIVETTALTVARVADALELIIDRDGIGRLSTR